MHIGKFSISRHTWNESFIGITEARLKQKFQLITPIIGQPIWLDGHKLNFANWWKEVFKLAKAN
ncbi:hypothetical protein [Entomomonas asaccharolytica]|uniref:hypothetical protein n=1 Tax=Entomomonas asaccharolytica TaxID=2785331 RepID=UPI001F28D7C2|nr:hypothetical protein [Entomomonas asaccharolytica]